MKLTRLISDLGMPGENVDGLIRKAGALPAAGRGEKYRPSR